MNNPNAVITFHRPASFTPIGQLPGFSQSQEAGKLITDVEQVGIVHASCYAAQTASGPTSAALVVTCAPGTTGAAHQIAQSLARAEAAHNHPATVLDVPAGPVALAVHDSAQAHNFPWPVARYRAWLPLPRYTCTIIMDLTTPHIPGWESYGPILAGVIRSVRVREEESNESA